MGRCGHARSVEDEEQGIYRGEVTTIMGALADLRVDVSTNPLATWKEKKMSGKRKRKKIPPETLERILAADENYQALLNLIERAKIELATGKRPPPDPTGA